MGLLFRGGASPDGISLPPLKKSPSWPTNSGTDRPFACGMLAAAGTYLRRVTAPGRPQLQGCGRWRSLGAGRAAVQYAPFPFRQESACGRAGLGDRTEHPGSVKGVGAPLVWRQWACWWRFGAAGGNAVCQQGAPCHSRPGDVPFGPLPARPCDCALVAVLCFPPKNHSLARKGLEPSPKPSAFEPERTH